jgi:amino acid transporter
VGSEPLMSAGGPLLGLLGIALYFILCQVPLLAMVTELCCAFPENGGHAVWALTALGPFWGFQSGYWSWISSLFNNAIYPGVIYTAITEAYGVEITSGVITFLIKVAIAIALALPSYFSVRSVGIGSLFLLVIVITIVLMFAVWAFVVGDGAWYRLADVRTDSDITDDHPGGGIDWTLLLHTLFWSFDGMFSISVIGGEVSNPARTFPRVMVMAAALTLVTYLVV